MKLRFLIAACVLLALFILLAPYLKPWVVVSIWVAATFLVNHLAGRNLRRKVEAKRQELGELDFNALASMGEADIVPTECLFIGPAFMGLGPASIEVVVEHNDAAGLRVLVRGSADVLLYTVVRFDGFYKASDGSVWSLTEAESDATDRAERSARITVRSNSWSTNTAMSKRDDACADREAVLRYTFDILRSVQYRCIETPAYSVCRLEAAEGADYTFEVWIYDSGDPQISAHLRGSPEGWFWGRDFELPDYPSVESRNRAFLETLEQVVTCPTRITQTKGWLFWDFHCDARVGDAWVSVGGHSAARWIRGIRDTGRKKAVYFSPAIRTRERAVEQGDEADERRV